MDHRDIIDLWPKLADFAADINVSYGTAKAMRRRNSIPSEYWLVGVKAAARRGLAVVTLAELAKSADARRKGEVAEVAE